ncbi:MAG: hypothetical protein JXM69_18010 [Anaerolineae bacterium]|nr:hypothetical protein [Anaerolineae bacterium]
MNHQNSEKLYWKDALRQVQTELDDEVAVTQNRRWASAFRQAEADLTSPGAVVWLPDEIADVLYRHPRAESTQANTTRPHAWAWLLLLPLLFVPVIISTLLAYRRIVNPIR